MSTNEFTETKALAHIEEPPITSDIETFFANYASIPASALREHLITVRERAWQKSNYPCLGQWRFLHFSIRKNPIYAEILEKCKNEDATVIDFGCCLGQDVRQLVYDGVPISQVRGYDIEPLFIEQGYELFRDGELMKAKKVFGSGDIFDNQFLESIEPADYVYADLFIHLFDVETQRDVCRRLAKLAKRAIAGRQSGAEVPGERPRLMSRAGTKIMQHSPESLARMWDDVTNGEWQVESATLGPVENVKLSAREITFVVRKREKL